jgi:predicted branched-subunit amino acid permease
VKVSHRAAPHAGGAAAAPASAALTAATDLAPAAVAVAPFGLVLGVTTTALKVGSAASVTGAGVVYAGTAQLTAMTLMSGGAGVLTVLLAVLVVNARFVLYGASLEPLFRHQPIWFRWAAPHFIVDQTFLAATTRAETGDLNSPARFRRYWLWLGTFLAVVWVGAVASGVLLGPALPELPHLYLAGTAVFLGLLALRLTSRPAVAAAMTAATTSAATVPVLHASSVIVATLAGVTAGSLIGRWSQ